MEWIKLAYDGSITRFCEHGNENSLLHGAQLWFFGLPESCLMAFRGPSLDLGSCLNGVGSFVSCGII